MGMLNDMAGAQPAPAPKKQGGGILSTIADLLKYGPFIGEARQNRQFRVQRQQQDTEDTALMRQFKQAQIAQMSAPKVPAPNDTERDYDFWQSKLSPEQFQQWVQSRYDPAVNVPLPDGSVFFGPRSRLPGAVGNGAVQPQAAPPGVTFTPMDAPKGGAGSGQRTFPTSSAVMGALIQQESGGRVGAVGPQTPYGRALGMTQMLPSTAKEVAGKLGVPFRQDLLSGKTPEAATYQQQLGEGYLQQGYDSTGNLYDALRFYHGGPNRKMWGPKTKRYADSILGRLGL